MKDKVRKLMETNQKSGVNKDDFRYYYVCPDRKIYPHQWFWDSCFHIIINSKLSRIEEAISEFKTLIHNQEENGWIGHMNYWEHKFSIIDWLVKRRYPNKNMTPLFQPAFLAHALNSIRIGYDNLNENHPMDKNEFNNFMLSSYTKVKNYYDCIFKTRLNEDIGLISIIHPWESGTDNINPYDQVLSISGKFKTIKWAKQLLKILKINKKCKWNIEKIREKDYFVLDDILVNSVYSDGLKILADVAASLIKTPDAIMLLKRAETLENSIIKHMYSESDGLFYNLMGKIHKQIRIKSISSLAPLNLHFLPENILLELIKHLKNIDEFNLPYPIPSVSADESSFKRGKSNLLWRGPTWINTNWYIIKGLEKQMIIHPEHRDELIELAEKLKIQTKSLIQKSGFREYYNPFSGRGYGAKHFSWSGLIIDL